MGTGTCRVSNIKQFSLRVCFLDLKEIGNHFILCQLPTQKKEI